MKTWVGHGLLVTLLKPEIKPASWAFQLFGHLGILGFKIKPNCNVVQSHSVKPIAGG